jgi:hypothetical protein
MSDRTSSEAIKYNRSAAHASCSRRDSAVWRLDAALVHFQMGAGLPQTPSCYAMTGWRRTESGRPAASIRFSTATPMAASVC